MGIGLRAYALRFLSVRSSVITAKKSSSGKSASSENGAPIASAGCVLALLEQLLEWQEAAKKGRKSIEGLECVKAPWPDPVRILDQRGEPIVRSTQPGSSGRPQTRMRPPRDGEQLSVSVQAGMALRQAVDGVFYIGERDDRGRRKPRVIELAVLREIADEGERVCQVLYAPACRVRDAGGVAGSLQHQLQSGTPEDRPEPEEVDESANQFGEAWLSFRQTLCEARLPSRQELKELGRQLTDSETGLKSSQGRSGHAPLVRAATAQLDIDALVELARQEKAWRDGGERPTRKSLAEALGVSESTFGRRISSGDWPVCANAWIQLKARMRRPKIQDFREVT